MLLLMGQKSVYSPQTCDLKIYSRLNQFLGSKVSKKTEERKLTTNKEVSWTVTVIADLYLKLEPNMFVFIKHRHYILVPEL